MKDRKEYFGHEKIIFYRRCRATLLIFAPVYSHALSIDFLNPNIITGGPGSTANAIIIISGLGDFAASSLGAFDLDIDYNSSIITPTTIGFAGYLGDPDVRSFDNIGGAFVPDVFASVML